MDLNTRAARISRPARAGTRTTLSPAADNSTRLIRGTAQVALPSSADDTTLARTRCDRRRGARLDRDVAEAMAPGGNAGAGDPGGRADDASRDPRVDPADRRARQRQRARLSPLHRQAVRRRRADRVPAGRVCAGAGRGAGATGARARRRDRRDDDRVRARQAVATGDARVRRRDGRAAGAAVAQPGDDRARSDRSARAAVRARRVVAAVPADLARSIV